MARYSLSRLNFDVINLCMGQFFVPTVNIYIYLVNQTNTNMQNINVWQQCVSNLDHINQLGVDGTVQQTALTFIHSRANLLILSKKKSKGPKHLKECSSPYPYPIPPNPHSTPSCSYHPHRSPLKNILNTFFSKL